MLNELVEQDILGSPDSKYPVYAALQANSVDPAHFRGLDASADVILAPSTTTSVELLMGKNGKSLPNFVKVYLFPPRNS